MIPVGFCPKCDYRTDVGVCPECGADVTERAIRSRPRSWLRRNRLRLALGISVLAIMGSIVATRTTLVKYFPTDYLLYLQEEDNALAVAATGELLARLQNGGLSADQGDQLLKSWFDLNTQIDFTIVLRSRNFGAMEPTHQVNFMPTRTRAGTRANLTRYTINVQFEAVRIDGVSQPVRFQPGPKHKISVSTGAMSDLAVRVPSKDDFTLEIDAVVTLMSATKSVASTRWEIREIAKLGNDPNVLHRQYSIVPTVQFINSSGAITNFGVNRSEIGREDLMFPYGKPRSNLSSNLSDGESKPLLRKQLPPRVENP
jgi:hypothetical protein